MKSWEIMKLGWFKLGYSGYAVDDAKAHWSGLRIFQQKLFDGKIASKLFKFEWFGIFKTSDG